MPESPAERAQKLLDDAAKYDGDTTLGPLVWQPLARDVLALSEQLAEARKREDALREVADWVRTYQAECENTLAPDLMLRASMKQTLFDLVAALTEEDE